MYSINVFLTFSLSMFGMLRHWLGERAAPMAQRVRRSALFASGFVLVRHHPGRDRVMEKFVERRAGSRSW